MEPEILRRLPQIQQLAACLYLLSLQIREAHSPLSCPHPVTLELSDWKGLEQIKSRATK